MTKSKGTRSDRTRSASALIAATMVAGPATAKAWTDATTECSRFVMDRLQQDMKAQRALLSCKCHADLLNLQTSIYQQAIRQYSQEASRLFGMVSRATESTMKEASADHARKFDDLPV
jgi:hypothetical protein